MLLKIIVYGIAFSALWLWAYALIRRELNESILKPWLKIIVPTGIFMSYALILMGVL